ncbi:Lrp/AsnC family transcriptional regulator [Candidatus Woesearchaeota archaeon]|nr:Lrp/AsnC family transcriptional regulator [Candidatus Woesearchaeota archaeon]
METDTLDKNILNTLIENSRLSYRQIAKKLKVSVATVMHRVNRLEDVQVIRQFTTAIDYEKLGYDVTVLIEVRISKGKLIEIEKKVATHPNVVAVYDHTGPFDALILAKFKTRAQMDQFLKKLQAHDFVERTETMLVLNTVKEKQMLV